jgi:hypothetical protein
MRQQYILVFIGSFLFDIAPISFSPAFTIMVLFADHGRLDHLVG